MKAGSPCAFTHNNGILLLIKILTFVAWYNGRDLYNVYYCMVSYKILGYSTFSNRYSISI